MRRIQGGSVREMNNQSVVHTEEGWVFERSSVRKMKGIEYSNKRMSSESHPDCFDRIRQNASFISSVSTHVKICDRELEKIIREEDSKNLFGLAALPSSWAQDYHYGDTANPEALCQYILVLDSLNFCFWPLPTYEYHHLASSLKAILIQDPSAFEAKNLIEMTADRLLQWLFCSFPLENYNSNEILEALALDERARLLREIGRKLRDKFDGKFINMVLESQHSAAKLVESITSEFPGFRDESIFQGRQVLLYKRAQILIGDLWGAFNGAGLGFFEDIENVTCFADYRIPQLLRDMKILKYSKELEDMVDGLKEIPSGSSMEIEIRGNTISAVEKIKSLVLKLHQVKLSSIQVDWLLWEKGESKVRQLAPHHRTKTIFY